jgi:hypothetical protein
MTKRKKIILTIAIVIIAVIALGAFGVYRFIDYDFESPQIAVFPSPDKNRSAYLIWHGALMGRTLTFLTSQTSSLDDVRWIGSVTADDSLTFQELLWSSDSSLVAARCFVGGYCKLPEGTRDQFLLTHGYDFKSLDRLVPTRDVFDATPEAWINRHAQLEHLFTQKGGQQICVSENTLYDHMRRLKWHEWRQWRVRLIKTRTHEANTTSEPSVAPAPQVQR